MKPGDIRDWLDQGPAILLEECDIPSPCSVEELGEFLADPGSWPTDGGWKIKLLLTGEIIEVHTDTLDADSDFIFKPEGIH